MKQLAVILLVISCSVEAQAQVDVYFGEDLGLGGGRLFEHPNTDVAREMFLDDLLIYSEEDFEGFASGTNGTVPLDFETQGMAQLIGDGCAVVNLPDGTAAGAYPISGDQFWFSALAVGQEVFSFTIEFAIPQRALGFYATDIGDIGAQVSLTLDGTTTVAIPASVNGPSGSVAFFGIICLDFSFTTVTVDPGLSNDGVGYDNLIVGTPEQEISTQQSTWGRVKALWSR